MAARSRLTLLGSMKKTKKPPPPQPPAESSDEEMTDYSESESEDDELTPEQKLKLACRKKLPETFTLNPPSGILARRSNPALCSTWRPVLESTASTPTSTEYPHSTMDSGYISHQTSCSPLSTRGSTASASVVRPTNSTLKPLGTSSSSTPNTIREYKAKMLAQSETLFKQSYVDKHFTHDSRKARKALKPVMRRCLDLPEDRIVINKHYLHINFKLGTIRGEHRTRRKRQMDMKQRRYEGSDYFTVKAPPGS